MGYYKEFGEFCRVAAAQLRKNFEPKSEPKLYRAFRRYDEGLPWQYVLRESAVKAERETVTCPSCEREAAVRSGGWHCFYCGGGSGGDIADFDLDPDLPDDEHAPEVRRRLRAYDREETLELAIELFNEADRLGGSIGEVYLKARGLDLPPNCDAVMRWHPRCPYGSQREQCVVSLMRNALTDEITALHRTHVIGASSGKAEKERKVLGRMKGSAIKLWPLGDSEVLAVGEGIETVLAAVALGIAEPPAWAATVANNLGALPVIPGVKRLIIFADNDETETGEKKARKLRSIWLDANREVRLLMPPDGSGKDFNDLLLRRRS